MVADYEDLVRQKDLVLGYRLHGNLMALANGMPSIYFTYDSRTAEFAETFQIPHFDVFSGKPFELEDYWDQSLFEKLQPGLFPDLPGDADLPRRERHRHEDEGRLEAEGCVRGRRCPAFFVGGAHAQGCLIR